MRVSLIILLLSYIILGCKRETTGADSPQAVSYATFNEVPADTINKFKKQIKVCLDTISPKVLASKSECEAMEHLLFTHEDLEGGNQAIYDWMWSQVIEQEIEKQLDNKNISLEGNGNDLDTFGDTPRFKNYSKICKITKQVDDSYEEYLGGPQSEINQATGVMALTSKFRLLMTYHMADSLLRYDKHDILAASYFKDYVLWEDVFKEFYDNYTDAGSSGPMILNDTYSKYAETRNELLKEEIGYFTEDGHTARWLPFEGDIDIDLDPNQKAIHKWYDYRRQIAKQLEDKEYEHNIIEYYRHITYKAVYIYQRLQIGWGYYFEQQ